VFSPLSSYLFPVNGLEGPQVDFGKTVSWMKNEVPADFEKILSRYNKYPKQVSFNRSNQIKLHLKLYFLPE
jgi:hypothetical protein